MLSVLDALRRDGYYIEPDVLTPAEVSAARAAFFEWKDASPNAQPTYHHIFTTHHVGHARHAKLVREHPKVRGFFQDALFSGEPVVSSFDGCCYMPRVTPLENESWTHTDQAPSKRSTRCYQGFVALTTNEHRTLRVYPGTHALHERYFQTRGLQDDNRNFHLIDDDALEALPPPIALHVPAGALVVWDSRLFHQSQHGSNPEERLVQYVCFLPQSGATKTQLDARAQLEAARRTTTHWPYPMRAVEKAEAKSEAESESEESEM